MKRFAAVIALTAALIVTPGVAQAADTPESCRVVKVLKKAGFKGEKNRIAYAIVMRESRGQNLSESSRWYSGALGMWQIQTSVWSGQRWWSRAAMLNPYRQSRIVYRKLSNRGTNWSHWGISRDGRSMDTTYYSGWSSSQQWAWIWAPYERFYRAYPRC